MMARQRAKIESGEGFVSGGSGDVYTSTRKLRENMKQMLVEDYGVKFDAKGVPDLSETPFYTGQGKLGKAIENFFNERIRAALTTRLLLTSTIWTS